MFVPARTASHLDSSASPTTKPLPELPTKPRALGESQRSQTPSLTDRLKNILPRHRPERGGTIRERGFWEQPSPKGVDLQGAGRSAAGSRQSKHSETADSDRITRWNTAKELPKRTPESRRLHTRAMTASIDSLLSSDKTRRWSWSPQEAPLLPGTAVANDSQVEKAVNHSSEQRAALLANRRLSHARQLIEAKRESRRNRRSLKESGDYLGVQGINPETGELDIVTPSDSEQSTGGFEVEQKVDALKQMIQTLSPSQIATKARAEREIERVLAIEHGRLQRLERDKEALKQANSNVRWRRQTKQWSSAQEPALSPIAQSHKNMTSSSSSPSPLGEKTLRNGELIDMSTSHGLRRVLKATASQRTPPQATPGPEIHAKGKTSTERSCSSGTVVRTPHRQSTAEISSAAQELYVNDIEFHSSDQPNNHRDKDVLDAMSDPLFMNTPSPVLHIDDTRSPRQLQSVKLGLESPEPPGKKTAQASKERQVDHSFLGLSGFEEADPGGSQEKETGQPRRGNAARSSLLFPRQPLIPKGRITQMHPEDMQDLQLVQNEEVVSHPSADMTSVPETPPQPRMSPLSSSPRSLERKRWADCDPETPSVNEPAELEELPSAMHSQRQFLESLHQDRTGDTACGIGSQDLRQGQPVQMPSRTQQHSMTKEEIQGDLSALNHKLRQIDQMNLTAALEDRCPNMVDRARDQDISRDITNNGNETMEVSASTTTTIITGSDPKASPSEQPQGIGYATDAPRRRKRGRFNWNLPRRRSPAGIPEGFQSSRTKPLPNASPSPARVVGIPAAGITSARHLRPTKAQTRTPASTTSHRLEAEVTADGSQCIRTSHMFTSMIPRSERVIKAAQISTQQEPSVAETKKEVKSKLPQVQPEVRTSEPKTAMMETMPSARRREQGPPARPAQTACSDMDKASKDLQVQIPGSYPSHLDGKDGIANPFNVCRPRKRREDSRVDKTAAAWEAMVTVFQRIGSNSVWLLSLYWATIRPVLKPGSEYWQRRSQHNWQDVVAIVLACPVAFFAIIGLF